MSRRKLSADTIFDGFRFREAHCLIVNEKGRVEDLVPVAEAGENIEFLQGILLPGMVNCHCHLELSHMKGAIPEGTGLVDFVFHVVTGRHYSEEIILNAIAAAEEEMYRNGIVAVGDICNNTLTLEQKVKGNLLYYNFIEASGWLPQLSEARFSRSFDYFEDFRLAPIPYNQEAIVPHAPYSVSEPLWQSIIPFFENKTVSIHNQEAPFEDELFIQGTGDFIRMYQQMKMDYSHFRPSGISSLQTYFSKLQKAASILLVHNTFTTQEDLEFLKARSKESPASIYLCLCVNANRYIENQLPPVDLFRQNHSQIVLGTDSLASNWSLSLFDEITTINHAFPHIPLEEILTWATSNGAKALNLQDRLGSFEKGKYPGVVQWHQKKNEVNRIF